MMAMCARLPPPVLQSASAINVRPAYTPAARFGPSILPYEAAEPRSLTCREFQIKQGSRCGMSHAPECYATVGCITTQTVVLCDKKVGLS
jgi:hypothetical protein